MGRQKIKYDSLFINELCEYKGNDFLCYINVKYFGYSQKDCLDNLYYMFVKGEISKELLYFAYQKIEYTGYKRKLNARQLKAIEEFFKDESYLNIDEYLKQNKLSAVGSLFRSFLETDYDLYCKYLLEKYRRELIVIKNIYEINEMISNNTHVDAYTCYLKVGYTAPVLRTFIGYHDTSAMDSFKGLYLNSIFDKYYCTYGELRLAVYHNYIGINRDITDIVINFMEENNIPIDLKIFKALYDRARSTREPFEKVLVYSN